MLYEKHTKFNINIYDITNTNLSFKPVWWFSEPKAIWVLVVYQKHTFSQLTIVSVFLSITSTDTRSTQERCLLQKFPPSSGGIRQVSKTIFALQDRREYQSQSQKCSITLFSLSFSSTSSSPWVRRRLIRPGGAASRLCDQGVGGLGPRAWQDAHLLCCLDIA